MTDSQPHLLLLLRRLLGDPERVSEEEVMGRCERAALATALRLRAQLSATVTAIAVGTGKREDRVLAMALRAGCDRAVRVHDPLLDDLDYLGIAEVIAATARRLGFDLVICGDRSQEELQGAIGPAVAELLEVAHLTGLVDVRCEEGRIVASHRAGDKLHLYRCAAPMVLAVMAFHRGEPGTEPEPEPPSRRSGAIEQLAPSDVDLDSRTLSHRRQFLGSPRAARTGCNATLVSNADELVARLVDDHLLG